LRAINFNKNPNKGRALATVCVVHMLVTVLEREGISDPTKETGNLQTMLHVSSYYNY